MGDAVRDTWNNERWVIDRLVDAVEAGDTDSKSKLGQRLLDGIDADRWIAWSLIEIGQFLPLTFLDQGNVEDNDLEWLCEDETISLSRANEILTDGVIGVELTQWRQRVMERAFFPDWPSDDMLWLVIKIRRTGRRVAFVAGFGYDLACLSFVAAYDTYTETMRALKAKGFTSWEDCQARVADALAAS